VQRELDEVVVVEPEALLFLVEIPVEEDVLDTLCRLVLGVEGFCGHVDHVAVVLGLGEELARLEHVSRPREGHVAQRELPLLVDDPEDGVYVRVVEHEKALGIAHCRRILLKHRYAEAMEGVDVAGVVVASEGMDALTHLVGGLVGEGDTEDVARHDAHLVDEVGKASGEGARLARPRPGDHANIALRGGDGLDL